MLPEVLCANCEAALFVVVVFAFGRMKFYFQVGLSVSMAGVVCLWFICSSTGEIVFQEVVFPGVADAVDVPIGFDRIAQLPSAPLPFDGVL